MYGKRVHTPGYQTRKEEMVFVPTRYGRDRNRCITAILRDLRSASCVRVSGHSWRLGGKTRRGPGLLAEGESARQRQRTELLSAATRIVLHTSDCDVGLPNLAAEFHGVDDTGGWRKGFHEGTQSGIFPQALGRNGNS